MDRFQELLWDLGELIKLPLHADKNNSCKIILEETLAIQLEMDSSYEQLLVAAFVSELPPGRFREDVLKEGLKANTSYHLFGTFAYIEKINTLIIHRFLIAEHLRGNTLAEFLEMFIKEAQLWRSAISMGAPAPAEYLKPPQHPPFL